MPIITTALSRMEKSFKQARHLLHVAEARAVKRAGASVKVAQSRDIGAVLNIKAAAIKEAIEIKRDTTVQNLSVTHRVEAKGIAFKDFAGTRQTKKGVSVKVLKTGGRALLRAAFAVSKFGGNFFGRVGKTSTDQYGRPHVGRAPITKLYGPNILSQYTKDEVRKKGADTWQSRITIELAREETFALKKAGVID